MSDTEKSSKKTSSKKERVVGELSPIATPLAGKKLTKNLYKVVKKASQSKVLRRGVKEVVKALRKGEKGLCIIAGDISPIDVISHLPILCEDFGIPYVFVPSKAELGEAAVTKRPTSCVLIVPSSKKVKSKDGKSLPKFDVEDRYNDALKEVDSIKPNFS